MKTTQEGHSLEDVDDFVEDFHLGGRRLAIMAEQFIVREPVRKEGCQNSHRKQTAEEENEAKMPLNKRDAYLGREYPSVHRPQGNAVRCHKTHIASRRGTKGNAPRRSRRKQMDDKNQQTIYLRPHLIFGLQLSRFSDLRRGSRFAASGSCGKEFRDGARGGAAIHH
jgi:hypothetical protein